MTTGMKSMDFSKYHAIALKREGRVLYATLNRPETLNAINGELEEDLSAIFDDVARDGETNVLVLSGAGRAFSAGGDIEQMQKVIDEPDLFVKGMATAKHLIYS